MDPAIFLDMDGISLEAYIDGQQDGKKLAMRMDDQLNYILGNYIAVAFHSPQTYPKTPQLSNLGVEQKPLTIEEQERAWMRWLKVNGAKEVDYGNDN